MFKKICFIVSAFGLLTLLGQQAQANVYKGYNLIGSGSISSEVPTKGTTAEGLRQTLLSQFLAGDKGEEFTITLPGEQVGISDAHQQPKIFYPRTFHLGIKHQKSLQNHGGETHLVMVVPGFGASFKSGAGPYLSDLLHRNGFLTIISNSPANPQFMLHSSTHGVPGYQTRDAEDLYKQLEEAIRVLMAPPYNYEINKVSVIGVSLGSMNATLLAKVDKKKKIRWDVGGEDKEPIGFHRVFAINPPVSNVYGSTAIDTFVAKAVPGVDRFDFSERFDSYTDAISLLINKIGVDTFDEVGPAAINGLADLRVTATDADNLKFLVGFGFADTVKEATVAYERRWADDLAATIYTDAGFLTVKFFTDFLTRVSMQRSYYEDNPDGRRPRPLPKAKRKYSFINDDCSSGSRDQRTRCAAFIVSENESVGETIKYFHEHPKISAENYHLVTWDDDFLLRVPVRGKEAEFNATYSQNDVEWIQSALSGGDKGNSIVFTNGGGHLGGYYQTEFQKYLLENLK